MEVSMNVQSYSYTTEIKRNQTAENISSFSEIQAVESQEAVGESPKTKQDYFRELCAKYPDASFVVIESDHGGASDNYQYGSICDTQLFSYPGKHSYLIPEYMLEKLSDPQYKKSFYQMMDNAEKEYDVQIMSEALPYKCMRMQEYNGWPFGGGICGCSGPMRAYIEVNNNSVDISSAKYMAIMKKISFMEDETYQKLVEDLFDDKDDKADSDKKRRMEQEYADRFETHQQYINGEISSREYSYN